MSGIISVNRCRIEHCTELAKWRIQMIIALVAGIILWALGIWMVVQAKKMNFERTNSFGTMEFQNFGDSYKHELKTRGLRMIGFALIFAGMLVFIPAILLLGKV